MKRRYQRPRKQELARNVVANRMLGGLRYLAAIIQYKEAASAQELLKSFKIAFSSPSHLQSLHGAAFPSGWDGLFVTLPLREPGELAEELIWTASLCSLASVQLKEFSSLRTSFELEVLNGHLSDALGTLDSIERKTGKSVWLAQNRLGLLQQMGNAVALDEYKALILNESDDDGLARFFLKLVCRKVELNGVVGELSKELDQIFEKSTDRDLSRYFSARLLRSSSPAVSDIPGLLYFEPSNSIVDCFEMLVSCLRSLSLHGDLGSHQETAVLARAIKNLLAEIEDDRLSVPLAALGAPIPIDDANGDYRCALIESCLESNLSAAAQSWRLGALQQRGDVGCLLLMLKSGVSCSSLELSDLLAQLGEHISSVMSKSAESYASALSVFAITERFHHLSWAVQIESTVRSELATVKADSRSQVSPRSMLADRFFTPLIALFSSPLSARILVDDGIRNAYPLSISYIECCFGVGLPSERIRGRWAWDGLIQRALVSRNWCEALQHADDWSEADPSESCARYLGALKASIHLANGNATLSAGEVVAGVKFAGGAPTIYPIREIAEVLEASDVWAETIDVPLLYELYLSFVDKDKLSNLRVSFEAFQEKNQIKHPADIWRQSEHHGEDRVISYLADVWKPEAMRQTMLYKSGAAIEDARIEVCALLQVIDSDNSSLYRDEFKQRVRQREINRGTTLVEQSKVYVDMAAIKRSLKAKLDGAYSRYKSAMQVAPPAEDAALRELKDLISAVESTGRERLAKALAGYQVLFNSKSKSDADVQFDSLYSQVMSEFVNGEHGLNAYLSTRVRHGKLTNALRKPLIDENIITARTKAGEYVPNAHWDGMLSSLGERDAKAVHTALRAFSEDFDRAVDFVNDNVIAVSLAGDPSTVQDGPAAFRYWATDVERRYLQDVDGGVSSFDEFVDRCMDKLWQKTDFNLSLLQDYLTTSLRGEIVAAFEHLSEAIRQVGDPTAQRLLQDSIGRARASALPRLNEVISWFKRNEFYDRTDYTFDFAIQVALNIINKTIPGAAGLSDLKVEVSNPDQLMPGRTLDGMVDMFDVLLTNSVLHSGLPIDELGLKISIELGGGSVQITVENEVAAAALNERSGERIEDLLRNVGRTESFRRAQSEGGSGLLKVWRTLNSTFYSSPDLDFALVPGSGDLSVFRVKMVFVVEEVPHEAAIG